jgi:hypothetical protein
VTDRIEALLLEIKTEVARLPNNEDVAWMVAVTVCITAMVIAVFVGILIYLQALHP